MTSEKSLELKYGPSCYQKREIPYKRKYRYLRKEKDSDYNEQLEKWIKI